MAGFARAGTSSIWRTGPPLHTPCWRPWCTILVTVTAAAYGLAVILQQLAADPLYRPALSRLGQELTDPGKRQIAEVCVVMLGLALTFFAPKTRTMRDVFRRLTFRRREAVVFCGLLPVAIRLALLPIAGVPTPKVADEFGHLLAADTFASGRIANPPHPLWAHFETIYVLQDPSYASIYPAAQGMAMAAAKIAGFDPWFGICVSVGAMCAALCWMLQGWLPAPWALIGAILAGLRLGIDTYWINSYWGGPVAAAGGALVLGALPRLHRSARTSAAVAMAGGLAVLAQSRPFEGFLLSIPVAVSLGSAFFRRNGSARVAFARRVVLPLAGLGAAIVGGILYYNWRVTGSALVLPYQLHQKTYGTPQNLRWAAEVTGAPRAGVHQDIADNFIWQRDLYRRQVSWDGLTASIRAKLAGFWSFFLGPSLALPLFLFGLAGRRTRLLALASLFVLIGMAILYPFFFPHYAAPVFGATLAVALRGLRRLRLVQWGERPIGRGWTPWIVSASVASAAVAVTGWAVQAAVSPADTPRSRIERRLTGEGGPHLVLLRYGEKHDFHHSWIYNNADIDNSWIVWARDLGEQGNRPLLKYFRDRAVWIAEVDDGPDLLVRYEDKDAPRITAVHNAAGKSIYFERGVAPGSIVTIFGRNLAGGAAGGMFPALRFPLVEPQPLNVPVQVRFGDTLSPVLATRASSQSESLTVQVPVNLPGAAVKLTVDLPSDQRTMSLPVLAANPGIFETRDAGGRLSGALQRDDGTIVSEDSPAKKGERLRLFTTGLGRDDSREVVVGVNHAGAIVRSVARAAGPIGFDVVTFEVPRDAPSGPSIPLSLAVRVDGKPVYSNASTIAIE